MKSAIYLIIIFISCGCTQRGVSPVEEKPTLYIDQYFEKAKLITIKSGYNEDQANLILDLIRGHFITGCGGISKPKLKDEHWEANVYSGYGMMYTGIIKLNNKSGFIIYNGPTFYKVHGLKVKINKHVDDFFLEIEESIRKRNEKQTQL